MDNITSPVPVVSDDHVNSLLGASLYGQYSWREEANSATVLAQFPEFGSTWNLLQESLDSLSRKFFSDPRLRSFVKLSFEGNCAYYSVWRPTASEETPKECFTIWSTLQCHISDASRTTWVDLRSSKQEIRVDSSDLRTQSVVENGIAEVQVAFRLLYHMGGDNASIVPIDIYHRWKLTEGYAEWCLKDAVQCKADSTTPTSNLWEDDAATLYSLDGSEDGNTGRRSVFTSRRSRGRETGEHSGVSRSLRTVGESAGSLLRALTGCFSLREGASTPESGFLGPEKSL
ncbi:hypothetical protein NliqN6_5163 [Naganishia liquefaciens]|uniref:Uncharacterized protein n=1 Tax=Naganishia liquefaciens TaxID=104408 RepID=A0A8H3TXK4_9TREE|nr:hypothetical protein NliqN6_5163 [Naganishia liquefaciens]